jgi:hypothetical protein
MTVKLLNKILLTGSRNQFQKELTCVIYQAAFHFINSYRCCCVLTQNRYNSALNTRSSYNSSYVRCNIDHMNAKQSWYLKFFISCNVLIQCCPASNCCSLRESRKNFRYSSSLWDSSYLPERFKAKRDVAKNREHEEEASNLTASCNHCGSDYFTRFTLRSEC